jgi:hypothetical protein
LIQRCQQEVAGLAAALIGRCLDVARDSLTRKRDSQRAAARDALEALDKYRAAVQSSFPAVVDRAIADAVDNATAQEVEYPREERLSEWGTLPGDTELALIEDSKLTRFIERARLEQAVQPVVERTLARFDALMSSVLEQPVVRPSLNPMRPEVLCRALMQTLDEQGVTDEVRRLWLNHLAAPYARELDALYAAMTALLERQGTQEACYRVKLTEGGVALPVTAARAVHPMSVPGRLTTISGFLPAPPSTFFSCMGARVGNQAEAQDLSDEQAIRHRRSPMHISMDNLAGTQAAVLQTAMWEFLHRAQWIEPYDAPLLPDYYAAVRQQLARIAAAPASACYDEAAWLREQAQLRALAAVDRPARRVTLEMPLSPQLWGEPIASPQTRARAALELKAQATQVSQALAIDAMRALVAQVVADERLLAPVREAVVALGPALLRLALAEPRWLGDEAHPARGLIEEIAQRSFRYNDEFAPEFDHFIEPVRQAVRELDAIPAPSGRDFEQRLKALQADWQTQDQAERQVREQGERSMAFAQERQYLADKIAAQLAQRSDLAGVPAVVADFLFKDWSLVIAHAQLTDKTGQIDPHGYLSIVTDLLWSVRRDAILRAPAKLFGVAPHVLTTLRNGLEMLGQETRQSQALFNMLLRFHQPALELRRARSTFGKGITSKARRLPAGGKLIRPGESLKLQTAGQPWIGRHEQEVTGFIDDAADTARLDWSGSEEAASGSAPAQSAEGAGASGAGQHTGDSRITATASASESHKPSMPALDEEKARAQAQLARLRCGDRVDLYLGQKWLRAELVWISSNSSLYMFVNPGGQPYSMTRRRLEQLLCLRRARLVDAGQVVDKALQTIAARASHGLAVIRAG